MISNIRIISALSFLLVCLPAVSQKEERARQIILKSLDLIQTPSGIQLDYRAHCTRLFTKDGTLTMKGKMFRRQSKRTIEWYNGSNHWSLNRASQKLKLNMPSEYGNDKDIGVYLQQVRTDYDFTVKETREGYLVSLKAKKNARVDIKNVVALIDRTTYEPIRLKMRWGIFWVTVDIKHIKKVCYPDSYYEFDPRQYPNVKVIVKKR